MTLTRYREKSNEKYRIADAERERSARLKQKLLQLDCYNPAHGEFGWLKRQVAGYRLNVAGCRLQVAGYKLQVTLLHSSIQHRYTVLAIYCILALFAM